MKNLGNGKGLLRKTGAWHTMMILLIMALCLFLLSAPTALAETETGGSQTAGTAGTTAAAAGQTGSTYSVSDDASAKGSITLAMKYKDSNNKEQSMVGGTVNIYDVTALKDWSQYTSAQLDAKNAEIANELLSKDLKGKTPTASVKIQNGQVKFDGLAKGYYVVAQSEVSNGDLKINPFVISIPDGDGAMNISAAPKAGIDQPKTPDTTNKKTPKKTKLPQTGMVLWPAFALVAGGLLLILIGTWLRRSGNLKHQAKAKH